MPRCAGRMQSSPATPPAERRWKQGSLVDDGVGSSDDEDIAERDIMKVDGIFEWAI